MARLKSESKRKIPASNSRDEQRPVIRAQTKQVQVKKRTDFNQKRVEWFDDYMNGKLPMLSEIGVDDRSALLTDEQQKNMAMLIQAGIAGKVLLSEIDGEDKVHIQRTVKPDAPQIKSMLEKHGYTPERMKVDNVQRRKLRGLVEQASDARNIFAEKNLGLVTMIAGRRMRTSNASGLDFDDLVAEGMGGLMVAIDHYNPSLGNKFSTPAAWWIDQPIRNYIDTKTKTIHMPTHMNNIYKAIYYAQKALRDRGYDDAQITDEMIANFCQAGGRDVTVDKIRDARKYKKETISYDAPVGDNSGNDKNISDLIDDGENVEEDILNRIGGDEVFNRIVSMIDDSKKREILKDWYMSPDTKDIITLSNVSRKHCLTRERVRQLKQEAELELRTKILHLAKEKKIDLTEML